MRLVISAAVRMWSAWEGWPGMSFPPESTRLQSRPLRTRPSFNRRRTGGEGASDKFHPLPADGDHNTASMSCIVEY